MPSKTPNSLADGQPVRVAECASCRQLFAVYATEGVVACPGCAVTIAVASLEIAELGIATPIADEEPTLEPIEPAELSLEPLPGMAEQADSLSSSEPEEPSVSDRPPTVAEWLRQSEAAQTEQPEPAPEPSSPKPSLSESLGWNPGGFQLDGLAESRASEPVVSQDDPTPAVAFNRDPVSVGSDDTPPNDFRFDYASSPLAEPPEIDPSAAVDDATETVSLELSGPPEEAEEDTHLAALLSGAAEPKRRGWAGPLTVVAAMLLIAAPVGYVVTTWPSEADVADAAENRGRRLAAETAVPDAVPKASTLPFGDEVASAPAIPPADLPNETPIQDPATQPASYEAPSADLPPNPFPAEGTIESPPFAGPSTVELTPQAEPVTSSVGDRYASMQVDNEPEEFALPEDQFALMESTPQPAAELSPIERTPRQTVGLVNAPTYSTQQLAEAFDDAVPAGRGFMEGTLDDPTQVSSMGQHYARLCYLAQVLTLLDPAEKQGGIATAELEAADVFKRLFRGAGPRAESRKIAGPWIGWIGRPHGGVFFAGMPEEMEAAGDAVQYVFTLGDVQVPVVMAERLNVDRFINSAAREVGVIGLVVENPREWIAGYEGDAERVVWARKTLPLREPREL